MLPHALPWERRALLRARAARAFPGAHHVHATRLAREPGGRRDDRVLFSAITRPEALATWLAPMEAARRSPGRHLLPRDAHRGDAEGHRCRARARSGGLAAARRRAAPDLLRWEGRLRFSASRRHARSRPRTGTSPASCPRSRAPGATWAACKSRAAGDGLEVHLLSHGERLEGLRRELEREFRRGGRNSLATRGSGHGRPRARHAPVVRRAVGRRAVRAPSRTAPGAEPLRDARPDPPHGDSAHPPGP